MKCILLCAGYATRLFPLTENFPKALIKVGGKPILDYTIEKLNKIDEVDEVLLITNSKYAKHFEEWKDTVDSKAKITIVDDGTDTIEGRLGAIGDTIYTVDKYNINEDLLIVAGDNLFDYELKDFCDFYNEKKAPCVVGQVIDDVEQLKAFGVGLVNDEGKLMGIEEKPAEPKSNIAIWAVYLYPKEVLPLLNVYKEEGYLLDSPGNFLTYLYKERDTYVYMTKERCFDVGTHKALEEVNKLYL